MDSQIGSYLVLVLFLVCCVTIARLNFLFSTTKEKLWFARSHSNDLQRIVDLFVKEEKIVAALQDLAERFQEAKHRLHSAQPGEAKYIMESLENELRARYDAFSEVHSLICRVGGYTIKGGKPEDFLPKAVAVGADA